MGARGYFIVLDGLDGCGKSTQARELARYLRAERGAEVEEVRDPGATPVGEQIRELLLQVRTEGEQELRPTTEALCYIAARAQLVAQRIAPALAAGRHVVCDRFALSTLAYQGYGLGLDLDAIRGANALAVGETRPDLTLVIDIPPGEGLARRGGAGDRIELRGLDYLGLVRDGFRVEAAGDDRARILDGDRSPAEVTADVRAAVAELLEGAAS
ncbi:MAG: dTMP kinase [Planctomycetota bacterium]|jgi:dTMP kinase